MGRSQGIITRQNRIEPGGGGTLTGANNGLSLAGTIVQLGGPLLKNTKIDPAGFIFLFQDPSFVYLTIDGTTGAPILGDPNFAAAVIADPVNSIVSIGDYNATQNFTNIDIDDVLQAIRFLSNGGNELKFDAANNLFDITFNGALYIKIDVPGQQYLFGDINAFGNQTVLDLSDSVTQSSISSLGNTMLFLDLNNGIFQLGASAGGTPNTSFLEVSDAPQQLFFSTGGNVTGLYIDISAGIYEIGDIAAYGNQMKFIIDDTNNVSWIIQAGNRYLEIDKTNDVYQIGDMDVTNAGTIMKIDANAGSVFFGNFIKGFGIGQLPTNSQLAILSLNNYANNAAAVANGLGVNDVYYTNVAGDGILKIVL